MINISQDEVEQAETFHLLTKLNFELLNEESAFNGHGDDENLVGLLAEFFCFEFMAERFPDVIKILDAYRE